MATTPTSRVRRARNAAPCSHPVFDDLIQVQVPGGQGSLALGNVEHPKLAQCLAVTMRTVVRANSCDGDGPRGGEVEYAAGEGGSPGAVDAGPGHRPTARPGALVLAGGAASVWAVRELQPGYSASVRTSQRASHRGAIRTFQRLQMSERRARTSSVLNLGADRGHDHAVADVASSTDSPCRGVGASDWTRIGRDVRSGPPSAQPRRVPTGPGSRTPIRAFQSLVVERRPSARAVSFGPAVMSPIALNSPRSGRSRRSTRRPAGDASFVQHGNR